MQLQVRTVQEISREYALWRVWGHKGGSRTPVPIPAAAAAAVHPAPSASHGNVQPVHAVQRGVSKVQAGRVRGEAEVGGVHGGGRVVQDAGGAEHLAVEVVDERQPPVWLHSDQGRSRGALQEVLQAARATTIAAGLPGGPGRAQDGL